jgi:hypothetical protein
MSRVLCHYLGYLPPLTVAQNVLCKPRFPDFDYTHGVFGSGTIKAVQVPDDTTYCTELEMFTMSGCFISGDAILTACWMTGTIVGMPFDRSRLVQILHAFPRFLNIASR